MDACEGADQEVRGEFDAADRDRNLRVNSSNLKMDRLYRKHRTRYDSRDE